VSEVVIPDNLARQYLAEPCKMYTFFRILFFTSVRVTHEGFFFFCFFLRILSACLDSQHFDLLKLIVFLGEA